MPLFSTPTQIVIVVLVFVAGWLLGLASHPGGKKWRDRYTAEREAHAANRSAAEQRYRSDQDRIHELERDRATLAKAAPVTAASMPSSAARPAYPRDRTRGWFDWGTRKPTVF